MTYGEFRTWMAYREKRGPLNVMVRMDYGVAQIVQKIDSLFGGKAKLSQYLLWSREEQPAEEAGSIHDIARMLGAGAKKAPPKKVK